MNLIESIKQEFHPSIYDRILSSFEPLELCLVKKKGLGSYALALVKFDENLSIDEQLAKARRAIRKSTKALWCLNEVGAYIVFIADKEPQNLAATQLNIDKSGFHAVIVQGIHIVAPKNYHLYQHSKWLNHTFGGSEDVSNRIKALAT